MEYVNVRQLASITPQAFAAILAGPPARAAAWVAAAAQNGIVDAQAVYGQYLLSGYGVERDPVSALTWFRHAANADHPMAMNMVGRCHELGWGTAICAEIAVYWYRLAARAGLDWGMYNFATALALGQGIAQDHRQALEWFQRAAARGHVKSLNYIGSFYEDGWAVDVNLDVAFDHYRRAAEGGDFRGQFNYARLLLARGHTDEAARWLRRVPDTATPAFLMKAAADLARSASPAIRALATDFADSGQASAPAKASPQDDRCFG